MGKLCFSIWDLCLLANRTSCSSEETTQKEPRSPPQSPCCKTWGDGCPRIPQNWETSWRVRTISVQSAQSTEPKAGPDPQQSTQNKWLPSLSEETSRCKSMSCFTSGSFSASYSCIPTGDSPPGKHFYPAHCFNLLQNQGLLTVGLLLCRFRVVLHIDKWLFLERPEFKVV